jgi:hypothetical protein
MFLALGVTSITLYAAGHTRMHSQSAAAPNLTLAVVYMHVTIPSRWAFAQTSLILEIAMGNQPTVIYIIILGTATQTLHMTVGGRGIVMAVASQIILHHPSFLRESFRPLWFLAPL